MNLRVKSREQIETGTRGLGDICGTPGNRGMRNSVSKFLMYFLLMLLTMLQPLQARADEQARIRDASVCLNATIEVEKEYGIQEHLLTTISSVETGRWDATTRQNVAWPWTVNAQGKGTFYPSKAEAIRAVKKLQAQGVKSIDVGCMQINLSYHPDAFESLEEAFDPKANVTYAAKFLNNLYENRGNDWIKAAMAYHSSVPQKAQRYKKKLVKAYEKVKQAQNLRNQKQAKVKVAVAKIPGQMKPAARVHVEAPHITKVASNPKREARLIADAKAWREAKLAEYRQRKNKQLAAAD